MATVGKFQLKKPDRDVYLDLVTRFPLASIRSEAHFAAAQEVIDRLVTKGEMESGEELYLDALSDLVASYEDIHHRIEPASDDEMLKHLLEAKGVTQAEVSRSTGIPKSSISEVIAGKKPLPRQMIRKLASYFGIDVAVLAGNI
jgi:HTH-type transcriptional regulator/antitoxin HigA